MSSSLQEQSRNKSFSVATFNVWFGSDGQGSPFPEERMKAVVQALLQEQHEPLIAIGFQEVIPTTATMLQSELAKRGFKLIKQPTNSYGCALAVLGSMLIDSGWQLYTNTAMKRCFLWARLQLDTQDEILVTTTHLESPFNAEGTTHGRERVSQIQQLESFCNCQLQGPSNNLAAAIITGDCNWDEKVPETADLLSCLENSWTDAWLATHENDPGYTFDGVNNSFLTGDRQGRLDRILIRSQSTIVPVETWMVGQDAIPGISITKDDAWTSTDGYSTPTRTTRQCPVLPSDHFGVVARLQKVEVETT